jgi:hypothetical protein
MSIMLTTSECHATSSVTAERKRNRVPPTSAWLQRIAPWPRAWRSPEMSWLAVGAANTPRSPSGWTRKNLLTGVLGRVLGLRLRRDVEMSSLVLVSASRRGLLARYLGATSRRSFVPFLVGDWAIRDYAMLLLLASYGLGCGEVASLRLDDIDWTAQDPACPSAEDRRPHRAAAAARGRASRGGVLASRTPRILERCARCSCRSACRSVRPPAARSDTGSQACEPRWYRRRLPRQPCVQTQPRHAADRSRRASEDLRPAGAFKVGAMQRVLCDAFPL